jgi:1-acyl-sn-glycerol-3-phosphate acyltransferase
MDAISVLVTLNGEKMVGFPEGTFGRGTEREKEEKNQAGGDFAHFLL